MTAEEISDAGDSDEVDEMILAPQPILKISSPVQNIIWSNDSSLFAFSDDSNLIIADGKTNAISEIIHTEGTIRDIQVSRSQSNENEELLILSGSNGVMLHALRKGAKTVFQNHPGGAVSAIAVSANGNYQAIASSTGPISLTMKLQFSGDIYTKTITGHKTGPYSLSFSQDARYLVSAADDGYVRVIRLEDLRTIAREPFANYLHAPVLFTAGGSSVFMATDEYTVNRTLVTGSIWLAEPKEYHTKDSIITYTELAANDTTRNVISETTDSYLIVLTEDQQFHWFDTESGEELGFIPRLAKSVIADFEFSTDGRELLIGYKDGSILRVDATRYWRKKGLKVQVLYASYYSNAVKGGTGPAIFEHDEYGLIPFGYPLPPDSFFDYADITAGITKMGLLSLNWDVPYNLGLLVQGSITHNMDELPLYVGFGVRGEMAFPDTNYPFTYKDTNGNILPSPYLVSAVVPFHAGYQVKIATGSFMFIQVFVGPGFNVLWAPGVANTGMFISGKGGASMGFQFNGFRFSVEASYDTISSLALTAGISVRLSLHDKEGM